MTGDEKIRANLVAFIEKNPQMFPRVQATMIFWAERMRTAWIKMAGKFKPSWWGQQYLGGGGKIKIEKDGAFDLKVSHDGKGDRYNYESVVHGGRTKYDMRQNVDKSGRARISKKGIKYLIIPMPAKGGTQDVIKTGETRESGPTPGTETLRNTYSYGIGKKGVIGRFVQIIRTGRRHTKSVKFITLSQNSVGRAPAFWHYPEITGVDYPSVIRDMMAKSQPQISKDLAAAAVADMRDVLKQPVRKQR